MYQNVIVRILETIEEETKMFKMADYQSEEDITPFLDARKFNILDLSSVYKSRTHFICGELEPAYLQETTALLDRLDNKRTIVDQSIIKFA